MCVYAVSANKYFGLGEGLIPTSFFGKIALRFLLQPVLLGDTSICTRDQPIFLWYTKASTRTLIYTIKQKWTQWFCKTQRSVSIDDCQWYYYMRSRKRNDARNKGTFITSVQRLVEQLRKINLVFFNRINVKIVTSFLRLSSPNSHCLILRTCC